MKTSQNDSSIAFINFSFVKSATSFCSSHRLNSIFNIESDPKITIIIITIAIALRFLWIFPEFICWQQPEVFLSRIKIYQRLFIHSQLVNDAVNASNRTRKKEWNKHTEMINVRWLDLVERFTQYIATFPYNIEPA